MRALLILSLGLLLSACGGSSSSSANNAGTPDSGTPDNSTPDTGSGGDSGSSGGDSGSGDSGSGDSGGDSGGTTTPDPVDCDWQTPADVSASETLGNTADSATYDLSSYSERTDLNADLTGTWVLLHQMTRVQDDTSLNKRTTSTSWQKFTLIIRDSGSGPEAASCTDGGFVALADTASAFRLPLFPAGTQVNEAEAPWFTLDSNSHMTAASLPSYSYASGRYQVTLSDQYTVAIKVSDAVTSPGSHSLALSYSGVSESENNADVWCFSQKRTQAAEQSCQQTIGTSTLSQTLSSASDSAVVSFALSEQGSSLASVLSYNNGSTKAIAQNSVPSALTAAITNGSANLAVSFDDAYRFLYPATSASGSYSLSIP